MKNRFFLVIGAVLLAAGLAGCDVSSTDSVTASATSPNGSNYDFSGTYRNPEAEDGNMLGGGKGSYGLTALTLMQYGTALEGYDSKNQTWSGTISSITDGGVAAFTLKGAKTTGEAVQIAGKLTYGSDSTGMLSGTWVEAGGYRQIYGVATVSVTTNTPSASLEVTAGTTSIPTGGSTAVKASGGKSPYTWTVSGGGKVSSATGNSTTYTAPANSTVATVTATDSAGTSDSVTITVGG